MTLIDCTLIESTGSDIKSILQSSSLIYSSLPTWIEGLLIANNKNKEDVKFTNLEIDDSLPSQLTQIKLYYIGYYPSLSWHECQGLYQPVDISIKEIPRDLSISTITKFGSLLIDGQILHNRYYINTICLNYNLIFQVKLSDELYYVYHSMQSKSELIFDFDTIKTKSIQPTNTQQNIPKKSNNYNVLDLGCICSKLVSVISLACNEASSSDWIGPHSFLITGDEGSGKSFLLKSLYQHLTSSTSSAISSDIRQRSSVILASFPTDFDLSSDSDTSTTHTQHTRDHKIQIMSLQDTFQLFLSYIKPHILPRTSSFPPTSSAESGIRYALGQVYSTTTSVPTSSPPPVVVLLIDDIDLLLTGYAFKEDTIEIGLTRGQSGVYELDYESMTTVEYLSYILRHLLDLLSSHYNTHNDIDTVSLSSSSTTPSAQPVFNLFIIGTSTIPTSQLPLHASGAAQCEKSLVIPRPTANERYRLIQHILYNWVTEYNIALQYLPQELYVYNDNTVMSETVSPGKASANVAVGDTTNLHNWAHHIAGLTRGYLCGDIAQMMGAALVSYKDVYKRSTTSLITSSDVVSSVMTWKHMLSAVASHVPRSLRGLRTHTKDLLSYTDDTLSPSLASSASASLSSFGGYTDVKARLSTLLRRWKAALHNTSIPSYGTSTDISTEVSTSNVSSGPPTSQLAASCRGLSQGVVLYGPSGCGKSHLARAIADEVPQSLIFLLSHLPHIFIILILLYVYFFMLYTYMYYYTYTLICMQLF